MTENENQLLAFEKQFPSLKDKVILRSVWKQWDIIYNAGDIKENCLDKQKVREAITKGEIMILDHPAKDKEKAYYLMALQDIRKELGLKGDE
jgi:hypothetical protein